VFRAANRSKRPQATASYAERSAAFAQIARSWLERERRECLAAALRAEKRAKARCLAAAREHFTRSERTGDAGDS
jgi:phage gp16-like protein